jgi:methylmalonyl-CoA mutase cobalamin-binding subunit
MAQPGAREQLRQRILRQLGDWQADGRPSREGYLRAAEQLTDWKRAVGIDGLWSPAPRMVTATLDDMLGHGLDLIHRLARLVGLRLHPLGLLQTPETIVKACRRLRPDLLGLTVLQFDSEDNLTAIHRRLPVTTRLIAGGPVFRADPQLAHRAGVDAVIPDAAAFLRFMLDFRPHTE